MTSKEVIVEVKGFTFFVKCDAITVTDKLILSVLWSIHSCFHWYIKCKNPSRNIGVSGTIFMVKGLHRS